MILAQRRQAAKTGATKRAVTTVASTSHRCVSSGAPQSSLRLVRGAVAALREGFFFRIEANFHFRPRAALATQLEATPTGGLQPLGGLEASGRSRSHAARGNAECDALRRTGVWTLGVPRSASAEGSSPRLSEKKPGEPGSSRCTSGLPALRVRRCGCLRAFRMPRLDARSHAECGNEATRRGGKRHQRCRERIRGAAAHDRRRVTDTRRAERRAPLARVRRSCAAALTNLPVCAMTQASSSLSDLAARSDPAGSGP
jgi:hypothetical protein